MPTNFKNNIPCVKFSRYEADADSTSFIECESADSQFLGLAKCVYKVNQNQEVSLNMVVLTHHEILHGELKLVDGKTIRGSLRFNKSARTR